MFLLVRSSFEVQMGGMKKKKKKISFNKILKNFKNCFIIYVGIKTKNETINVWFFL